MAVGACFSCRRRMSSSVGIRMPPQRSGRARPAVRVAVRSLTLRIKSYADKVICIRLRFTWGDCGDLDSGAGGRCSVCPGVACTVRRRLVALSGSRRGLYRPADAAPADWDWIEAASRRRDATICLTSGLAYYDLTDAIPRTLDIAIPRGTRIPAVAIARSPGICSTARHSALAAIRSRFLARVCQYGSTRRSAASSMRFGFGMSVGYELGRDALREWLRRGGKPGRLMEIATVLPRAKEPLLRMLEALE